MRTRASSGRDKPGHLADGARHQRALPIGADDQARPLRQARATAGVAADADDPQILHQQPVHGEGGPHLRAGL